MDANNTVAFEDDNLHLDGKPKGLIFVVSAPSGTGKTTLCNMLLQEFKDIKPSVSFTTRAKRQGEEDGISYHFINDAEFDKMVERDEFIEWANVFGKRYGTAYKSVSGQNSSLDALLEIDVQGVEKLLEIYGAGKNLNNPVKLNKLITVFITPPSYSELAARLQKRGNMAEAELNKRLKVAYAEIKKSGIYDYIVTNDNLDDAYLKLKSIVVAERCKNLRKK
ncbi:MAG: guanylate kinase [bacterium]